MPAKAAAAPTIDKDKPRRGRPRGDGRAPISRNDILEAAWRKLAHASVAGTSVKDVADELGCHTASVFHQFPTKQALIAAVAQKAFTKELEWFRAIEGLGAAPDVTLFRILHDDAYFVGSGAAQVRSVFLAPELRNDGCPELDGLMTQYQQRLVDLIGRAVAEGLFHEVDAAPAADCLNALGMVGAVRWDAGQPMTRELSLTAARLGLAGLLADPARLGQVEREAMALKVRRGAVAV